jgi:hypothetical protein
MGFMKIGRNAGSGRFTTVRQAESRPNTHVVETVDNDKDGGGKGKGKGK